jgi:hypothetical protein
MFNFFERDIKFAIQNVCPWRVSGLFRTLELQLTMRVSRSATLARASTSFVRARQVSTTITYQYPVSALENILNGFGYSLFSDKSDDTGTSKPAMRTHTQVLAERSFPVPVDTSKWPESPKDVRNTLAITTKFSDDFEQVIGVAKEELDEGIHRNSLALCNINTTN